MRHFFIMVWMGVSLFATQLHWYDEYNEALRVAQKSNKPVYIFISSAQCGWCQKFENTTLQDEAVKKRLYQEFVVVHLVRDFDDIPKKFKTAPVPRHYFVDSRGTIVYDSLGYRDVDTFEAFMGYAKEQIKTKEKEQ